jgi:DNA polymerase III gamma/tau subunit
MPSDNHNPKQIKGAMKDALTIVDTAILVMNNDYENEKVQSMVKSILGDDDALQGKVDKAKSE